LFLIDFFESCSVYFLFAFDLSSKFKSFNKEILFDLFFHFFLSLSMTTVAPTIISTEPEVNAVAPETLVSPPVGSEPSVLSSVPSASGDVTPVAPPTTSSTSKPRSKKPRAKKVQPTKSVKKRSVRKGQELVPPQLLKRPALKRLARRAGITRLSQDTYAAARQVANQFVKRVVDNALLVTKHAGRKTVTCQDVLFSLKQLNHPVM
jgi:histone H3/H4